MVCLGQTGARRGIEENLEYRARRGDLGILEAGKTSSRRAVPLARGGAELLARCQSDPARWSRDPLLSRFGHKHPFSTIGCREKASPGLHLVLYKTAEGQREAWIHFDLYGPQNPVGHLSEVLRNRLTFGRTSEYEVYRRLVEADDAVPPAPAYDLRAHADSYAKAAFSPGVLGAAALSGVSGAILRPSRRWGTGPDRFVHHVEANAVRNTAQQGIEFAASAFLQQDESFTVSHQDGFRSRAISALYRSFFVPGRDGDELAFPRIASAFGTAYLMHRWHPWDEKAPGVWFPASMMLGRYVARSYWHEFRPEFRRGLQRALRRRN